MLQLPKHRNLLLTLAGLAAVVLCISIIALATPAFGALSNFVFSAAVLGGKVQLERNDRASQWEVALHTTGETDVITQVVTIAPGGFTGWHTHPGPQILSVNAGTGTLLYHGDDPTCTGEVIAAGHSHIDDGSEVRNFRNEGATNVVVYNTYLAPHGAAQRIDAPAPGNCPF